MVLKKTNIRNRGRLLAHAGLLAVVSSGGIAVMLLLVEIGLRYFTGEKTGNVIYTYHPAALAALRPGVHKPIREGFVLRTNEIGVRDDDPLCHRPDILLFGDSNVFAEFLPFRHTLGERLESKLTGVCAINFGVPGYGPDQSLLRMKYELDRHFFRPRVIVFHVFADNDLGDLFRNNLVTTDENGGLLRTGRTESDYALSWLERLQANSLVGRRLRNLAVMAGLHVMSKQQYPPERNGVYAMRRFEDKDQLFRFIGNAERITRREYESYRQGMYTAWLGDVYDYAIAMSPESEPAKRAEELMKAIFAEAKKASSAVEACLVILIQPSEWDASDTGPVTYRDLELYSSNFGRGYDRRNLSGIMKRAATASGVTYIDLFDVFSSAEARPYDPVELDNGDNHWNVNGVELASEALRSVIQANKCLAGATEAGKPRGF